MNLVKITPISKSAKARIAVFGDTFELVKDEGHRIYVRTIHPSSEVIDNSHWFGWFVKEQTSTMFRHVASWEPVTVPVLSSPLTPSGP